jgi:hypothetical protein
VAYHGLQALPERLPLVDFGRAQPHRSRQYTAIAASRLAFDQVLQMARVVAMAFARREPQTRHLHPPKSPPAGLLAAWHVDPFGTERFGAWTRENLVYWVIRLLILTDPTSPKPAIRLNEATLAQSLAIVDQEGRVLGGAFNETMPALDAPLAFRPDDLFLQAAFSFVEPIFALLHAQQSEALTALCARFPAFRGAYAQGKVGHHFMVARSDALPKDETFELVAATAAHYQQLGYAFMVIEATNQWTGAACEALGGVRVHFAPFQAERSLRASAEPLEGAVTSPSGFLSDKDSGSMFYVIRLA